MLVLIITRQISPKKKELTLLCNMHHKTILITSSYFKLRLPTSYQPMLNSLLIQLRRREEIIVNHAFLRHAFSRPCREIIVHNE